VGSTWQRGREGRGVTVREGGFLGCGLDLELGQIVSPGALLYFYFLSSFLFLFSLNLSYLLQKGFKSIQTTFRNFLKFKIIIQNSNIQVFIIKNNFLQNHMKWPKVFFYLHNANRNWV
jgi:hypothetical protein